MLEKKNEWKKSSTRWFKVTILSPSWRSLNLWRGHLTIPERSLAELPGIQASFQFVPHPSNSDDGGRWIGRKLDDKNYELHLLNRWRFWAENVSGSETLGRNQFKLILSRISRPLHFLPRSLVLGNIASAMKSMRNWTSTHCRCVHFSTIHPNLKLISLFLIGKWKTDQKTPTFFSIGILIYPKTLTCRFCSPFIFQLTSRLCWEPWSHKRPSGTYREVAPTKI